jgi:hypothetical protein
MKIIKKYFSVAVVLIFLAGSITVFGASNSENKEEITLTFNFSKPKITNDEENGFISIEMQELPYTNDLGKPILPIKPVKILLPHSTEVENIKVITSGKNILGSGYNIKVGGYVIPISKTNIKSDRTISEASSTDSLFNKVGTYNLRGFRIIHINLHPVQYISSNGELSYFENMKISIETRKADSDKAFRGLEEDFDLIEKIVDNPDAISSYRPYKKPKSADNYEYVIITANKLKQSSEEYTFQDLIDFKIADGISAKIVTTEEIMNNNDYSVDGEWGDNNPSNPFYNSEISGSTSIFDDKAARIRNFIRYAYTELGTNYVLLGGDADPANTEDNIVPLRGLFANESGLPLNYPPQEEQDDIPSDVYYACLDGNFNYDCDSHFGESADRNDLVELDEADLYAEVWVGRCCADSTVEVSNFIKKTLDYAQSADPYLSEIMFVGEDLGSSFYFQYGGDYKDMMEYLVPDSYTIHKLYDSEEFTWYPEDFYTELESVEPQIINHDGHGYTNYMLKMGSYDFYEFTNEKPFFIYSHSCLTGAFDNFVPYGDTYLEEDCIAEIITCEIPYGAYACILNSRYGLGSENSPEAPSGSYDESFYKALFSENILELGRANHWSKEDNIFRINENGYRWCFYQTNLFGDPQLRIKEANSAPNKPSIIGPTKGIIGNTYDYTVSAVDPEGDDVYFYIEWFEGCPGVYWQGPYRSGEEVVVSYTWSNRGTHTIRVKAKDTHGGVSYTETLDVDMPRTRSFSSNIFLRLIEVFNILQKFFIY